jgi:hypothetical protein
MKTAQRNLHVVLLIVLTTALSGSVWAQKEKPLTTDQAMQLLSTANTAAQHEQLAQYFEQKAAKLETEAKEHLEFANAYHRGKTPNMTNAGYCEKAASEERKAAQEDRAIAGLHHKMAEEQPTSAPQ